MVRGNLNQQVTWEKIYGSEGIIQVAFWEKRFLGKGKSQSNSHDAGARLAC